MLFSGRIPYLTDVRIAVDSDLKYILSLHRANAEALGWFPASAFSDRLTKRLILIARDNGEPCGYLMTTGLCDFPKITHACIQYDARGRLHGFGMVHRYVRECMHAACTRISLRCRDGLPSNLFWSDAGFVIGQIVEGTNDRGLCLNNWQLDPTTLPADSPYHVAGPNEGGIVIGQGSSKSRDTLIFPVTSTPNTITLRTPKPNALIVPSVRDAAAAAAASRAPTRQHAARSPGSPLLSSREQLATPGQREILLAAIKAHASSLTKPH